MMLHEVKGYEPLLPPIGKGMDNVTKQLLTRYRELAAKHGFTIDGATGKATGQLPVTRKDFILMGGTFIPKGGIRGEEKQKVPFEQRMAAFVHDLWNQELKRLLARSINNDLETDYEVVIQKLKTNNIQDVCTLRDGRRNRWIEIEKTTPEQVISNLTFSRERRDLPYCVLTWGIIRSGSTEE